MKKIPTLFERVFDNHHKVGINNKVHPGMESSIKATMQNAARFRRRMRFPAAIRTP